MSSSRDITLDELDPPAWGEPAHGSHLVQTCHQLRRKPLGEFSTEDLRIMILQDIGLNHLLPFAVDLLERDPLASGNLYEGDLLTAVLRLPTSAWAHAPDLRRRLCTALASLTEVPPDLSDDVRAFAGAVTSAPGVSSSSASCGRA